MDMELLWDYCDLLEKQIEKAVAKGDITPQENQALYYAIKAKYYIYLMDKMENGDEFYDEESFTNRGSYRGRSSRRGQDYSNNRRYSERRSRGMSNHDDKDHMLMEIDEMKRRIEQM